MPLIKSASKAARSSNIAEMIKAGHPRDQAIAAAYATARKAGAKFADGGDVDPITGTEPGGGFASDEFKDALHRAAISAGAYRDPNRSIGQTLAGAAGMALMGAPMEARTPVPEPPPAIRAFHGSPYDFSVFDSSKIGTGEGAQAYGHGLYFAEHEPVAQSYKNVHRDRAAWSSTGDEYNQLPEGHMYEVNINHDPEHFLDWDKPFDKQSEHVQNAIRSMQNYENYKDMVENGVELGPKLKRGLLPGSYSPEGGATNLQKVGIPGIKYLDQGSRGVGKGTSNFVVFDPKTIEIMRKYGMAGLIGSGAYHFQGEDEGHAKGGSVMSAMRSAKKFAMGGQTPWYTRSEARSVIRDGMLHSTVPGRTDKLPIGVGANSYVLPADHVSALGQNNSAAGANVLNRMFKMGPYGAPAGKLGGGRPNIPRLPKAGGGATEQVPIIAAGGEFVVPPEKVAEIGGGDIQAGHKILDKWVEMTRKKHIKTLKGLPLPKKD